MKKKRSMSTSTKSYRASSTDMRGLSPNHPFHPRLPIPPARLANSSCQIDDPMGHYIKGKYVTAPAVFRAPHSALKNSPQIAQFLCNLSPLDTTLTTPRWTPVGLLHPLAPHRKSTLRCRNALYHDY